MRTSVPTRRALVLSLTLSALALAGCGTASSPGDGGATSSPDGGVTSSPDTGFTSARDAEAATPWLTPDGDVLVTCGHEPAFPVSLVEQGGLEVTPELREEIVATLDRHAQETGIDAPGPLQDASAEEIGWALVWQGEESGTEAFQLLLAEAGAGSFSLESDEPLTMRREDGDLMVTGWSGRCGARPFLPADRAWVTVALPDGAAPSGTSIELLVSEIECTSARDPEPFLGEPLVVETADSVTIYQTSEQPSAATCPGNPWVERTVELDAPLGDRQLLDGSTWPASAVTERSDL